MIKNTKSRGENISPEIQSKIDAILAPSFGSPIDTDTTKKQIFEALHGDKKKALSLLELGDLNLFYYLPGSLKSDPEIVKKALSQNPAIYKNLSQDLQNNVDIQKIAISQKMETSGNIIELISIVEKNKKTSKKLKKYLASQIEKNPKFFTGSLSKLLYEIYVSEQKIYDSIILKGFLSDSHNSIGLGDKIIKILAKTQSEYESDEPLEIQQKLLTDMLRYLGLKQAELSKNCSDFFTMLVSQIEIVEISEEEDENNADASLVNAETQDDDDGLDMTVGPYHYISQGSTCKVWDESGVSVTLEKKNFESMSEQSLKNYIQFTKILANLGLSFFIDKQERLSQIATGVDFYDGEGMTEGRILKFLNNVGKNIGVPEESYEDDEGNHKTGCFHTLAAAKLKFREIRDTQNIGEMNFSGVQRGNKTVVEMYMKMKGLLVDPFGDISLAKWK